MALIFERVLTEGITPLSYRICAGSERVTAVIDSLAAAVLAATQPGTEAGTHGGPAWSPYIVGAGIGVLSWFTFLVSNRAIGVSGGYANLAGMIGNRIARRHTAKLDYFQKNPPRVNWGLMLLVGILLGAAVAAWTGGEITNRFLPPMWEARFGPDSHLLRVFTAFIGGALMAFGARIAGGCTSGHGISGTLQLSVSSWIAVICFFIGGIAVATLLFRL